MRVQSETRSRANYIDESVNIGLRQAGIPDIPSGYDWYVLAPAQITDGSALDNALRDKNSTTDNLHAARIIARLYNDLVR
ncbi:hypothetical protein CJ469_06062 [Nocardia farcinica]|nr:hypothetical protein CJ469_06062 [Nocardia farcinica]PFX03219.1 hypothetical protein CJ468_05678 [Nocardia farcinica]